MYSKTLMQAHLIVSLDGLLLKKTGVIEWGGNFRFIFYYWNLFLYNLGLGIFKRTTSDVIGTSLEYTLTSPANGEGKRRGSAGLLNPFLS